MDCKALMKKHYDKFLDNNNWEDHFKFLFINGGLKNNPYKIDESKFFISELLYFLRNSIQKYLLTLDILDNINDKNIQKSFNELNKNCQGFDVTKIFKTVEIKYESVLPFSLSIPSTNLVWSCMYSNLDNIPEQFVVKWDKNMYDNFQIKIDNLYITELIFIDKLQYTTFRTKNYLIFIFEKISNHNKLTVNVRKSMVNSKKKKLTNHTSLIDIAFNQLVYKYNLDDIKKNRSIVEARLKSFYDVETELKEEKKQRNEFK